jgi:hypothetical protein
MLPALPHVAVVQTAVQAVADLELSTASLLQSRDIECSETDLLTKEQREK